MGPPADYGRPVRVFVKRRIKNGVLCHSYYVSSLALASKSLYLNSLNRKQKRVRSTIMQNSLQWSRVGPVALPRLSRVMHAICKILERTLFCRVYFTLGAKSLP